MPVITNKDTKPIIFYRAIPICSTNCNKTFGDFTIVDRYADCDAWVRLVVDKAPIQVTNFLNKVRIEPSNLNAVFLKIPFAFAANLLIWI